MASPTLRKGCGLRPSTSPIRIRRGGVGSVDWKKFSRTFFELGGSCLLGLSRYHGHPHPNPPIQTAILRLAALPGPRCQIKILVVAADKSKPHAVICRDASPLFHGKRCVYPQAPKSPLRCINNAPGWSACCSVGTSPPAGYVPPQNLSLIHISEPTRPY